MAALLRFAVLAAALAIAPAAGAGGPPAGGPWRACAAAAAGAGRAHGLPPHLLGAMAKVESGRWHAGRRARIAWPWTVTAAGRGRFLPSKAAAIAEVRRLRARGVASIDVGCLQVNLRHHPEAFADLAAAFDPAANAAYAAAYLARLHAAAGAWTRAIGDYHSRTPRFSGPYRLRVFRAWRAEKKAAYRAAARERWARARLARSLPAPQRAGPLPAEG